jgi:hypothetical protein
MANEVKIEISLEEKQALDALTKLIKKTDQFTESVKTSAKASESFAAAIPNVTRIVDMLGNTVSKSNDKLEDTKKVMKEVGESTVQATSKFDIFAGSLAANIATGALNFLKDSAKELFNTLIVDGIAAAQASEQSLNKLATSLKISGVESVETTKRLDEFAKGIERATGVQGSMIVENIAMLQSMANLTEGGLKQGTKAAVDLSSAMGISLESAIRMVGKAANGEVSGFKKFGIEIKEGRNSAETLANTLEVLNNKVGGSAAAQTASYTGKINLLKTAFGDLQTETGNVVIRSQAVQETIELITKGITILTSELTSSQGPASALAKSLDFLLITPAKFWADFFFGDMVAANNLTEVNSQLESTTKRIAELQAFSEKFKNGIIYNSIFGAKNQTEKELGELLTLEQQLIEKKKLMSKDGGEGFVGPASSLKNPEKPEQLKLDPMADVDVVYEQEKQAILFALKEEQSILEAENKAMALEAESLEGEEKLLKLQEQNQIQTDILKNAEDTRLANAAKNKADLKALNDKFAKEANDKEKKELEFKVATEKRIQDSRIQAANNFFAAGAMLAKDGSNAQKAILSAQAIMNTYVAATAALAAPPVGLGPVAGIPLMASTVALGLANVAKINGVKFQTGGFVGGNSIAGDQNIIRANSDEFVATRAQQRNMIEAMASGGAGGGGGMEQVKSVVAQAFSQPIIVQVEGREIARATRQAEKEGYIL